MESVGTLADGEYWSALCGMSTEEADFMAQLLGSCALSGDYHEQDEIVSSFGNSSSFCWPSHEPGMGMGGGDEKTYYCSDDTVNINPNLQNYLPQGSSYSGSRISSFCFPTSSHKNYYITDSNQMFATDNNGCVSMDICMVDDEQTNSSFPDNLMEEPAVCMNQEMSHSSTLGDAVLDQKSQPKRKFEMPKPDLNPKDENNTDPIGTPKRRCQVQRNKRNADSKKNQQKLKAISNDEEKAANIAGLNGQGSSSCSSEDDSNTSQELNGGETSSSKGSASLNSNGKARASRGSATDPHSLYARKRRERINERLKVLQNLVPNGTKVDISTMLEEAAQYVKFLQLQIKLLSSDDLWMYAPIAYNGMDIGLDLKISPSR